MSKSSRLLSIFSKILIFAIVAESQAHPESLPHRQKLTHLKFYFHDVFSGEHPTAVKVAEVASLATNTTGIFFGQVYVIDNLLTVLPDPRSEPVGRAQGMFAAVSRTEVALMMDAFFVFTAGEYNGSTVNLHGRKAIVNGVMETPIVGGTGVFRFASGFAQARIYSFNRTSWNAVMKFDVYVRHYL